MPYPLTHITILLYIHTRRINMCSQMFMPSSNGFSPIWNNAIVLFIYAAYTLSPFWSFSPSSEPLPEADSHSAQPDGSSPLHIPALSCRQREIRYSPDLTAPVPFVFVFIGFPCVNTFHESHQPFYLFLPNGNLCFPNRLLPLQSAL